MTTENIYNINLNITTLLGIDRAKGTLCIRSEKGETYLSNYDLWKHIHKEKPKGFDIEKPLKVKIDYPCKDVDFEIIPYNYTIEHQDADKDLKIPLYPIGYIAWCIAKKYEEIYKDTDKYDVWGHGIEDLFFDSFVLKSNNVLKINICS